MVLFTDLSTVYNHLSHNENQYNQQHTNRTNCHPRILLMTLRQGILLRPLLTLVALLALTALAALVALAPLAILCLYSQYSEQLAFRRSNIDLKLKRKTQQHAYQSIATVTVCFSLMNIENCRT